jgi:hypothetical protein
MKNLKRYENINSSNPSPAMICFNIDINYSNYLWFINDVVSGLWRQMDFNGRLTGER